ncbi:Nn.00g058250.m01.CDS01 [Neocucurbitaria sp. VM-36]
MRQQLTVTCIRPRMHNAHLNSGESKYDYTLIDNAMVRYAPAPNRNPGTGGALDRKKAKEVSGKAHREAQKKTFRVRKANQAISESRKRRKRVYRLKNGLISLNKTPQDLVSVARDNGLSPLLRLPAEIRTQIWEYTLGGMRILSSSSMGIFCRPEGSDDPNHIKFYTDRRLALLQVCRQIYSETATLTFSTNLFCFFGREALEKVWKRTRPAQRDAVKRMVVDRPLMLYYVRPKPKPKLKRLFASPCAAFPNLKTMVIEPRSLMDREDRVTQFLEMVEEVSVAQGLEVKIMQ